MNLNEGGMQGVQTKEQIERMVISKFETWKRKMGKEGVGIEVYSKSGDYLYTHFGTPRELYERMGVKFRKNATITITSSLKNGRGLVYGSYVIQWEGDDKIAKYLLAKEKKVIELRKAPMTEKRLKALRPNTSREWIKKKIVDVSTGEVAFGSISEFAKHEGICAPSVMKRFRAKKYEGKYCFLNK
jgi:hypothetical protein